MNRRASVYLLYDVNEVLLYVGMTTAGMNRFNGHIGDKDWWHEVVRAEFRHCGTEYQARHAEGLLIRDMKPVHNIVRPLDVCRICQWAGAKRDGRCSTCGMYWRRHGVERPEGLIVKHGQRILEKNRGVA